MAFSRSLLHLNKLNNFEKIRFLRKQSTKMAASKPEESPQSVTEPNPIDYDYFVNDFSKLRHPSAIRELNKLYCQKMEMISLAGGLPNVTTFPFKKITVTLCDDTNFSLQDTALHDALQYIPTQGYPPLLEKLKYIQWDQHSPPCWDKSEVLVTPGSQDGLCKSIEMSLMSGEPFICQHPIYSGTECMLKPFQSDMILIEQDEQGMIPGHLRQELEKRLTPEEAYSGKKGFPKMMYVNPTGANPTGAVLTNERKREIYSIACQYNLIILEDDPYYYLYFDDTRPESFLSMDTEGRVLRFDSFSKIMSPGLRVGYVTGPKHLIERIELHIQAAAIHACALSQVIINSVIESWGYEKLFRHFDSIRKYYRAKKERMVAAAEKHLTGLAEWNNPPAGMFLWIKVRGIPDSYNLVTNECIKQGVMFVTGHAFRMTREPCPYFRACFSLASPEQIDIGMERLAAAIRKEVERYKSGVKMP